MTADLNHEWILAEIGGTHARFNRWSTQSGLSDSAPARYRNDDFNDLAALIMLGRYCVTRSTIIAAACLTSSRNAAP